MAKCSRCPLSGSPLAAADTRLAKVGAGFERANARSVARARAHTRAEATADGSRGRSAHPRCMVMTTPAGHVPLRSRVETTNVVRVESGEALVW